jgi:hypothetical protein
MYNDVSNLGVPTYPTVPKPHFSNMMDGTHQTHKLTVSRRKPLPKPAQKELSTVLEHKPPIYRPVSAPPIRAVSSIDDIAHVFQKDDAVIGHPCFPVDRPSSRTSTISSLRSAKSHTEPGPIHIRPSCQLQSMQSISELDARLEEATNLRKPWRMSWPNRSSGQATYTPTGTPESISNVPLSAGVYEAHSRLNRNILPEPTDRVGVHDWARSSEWVEPSAMDQGSTEWIKDFLARQEQADREEKSERRRLAKRDSKYGSIRSRVGSTGKFRRKLSMKRVASERGSFEARQEKRNGRVFDLNIGSFPNSRAIIPIPGEDLERSASSRAFSCNYITDQLPRPQTAVANRSSWAPTPSATHITHAPERLHMSLPSRWSSHHPSHTTFPSNPYQSTSAQQTWVTKHGCHTHGRTSSWEKLKVKAVTSIGSDLKRSISTGVVPVFSEGKGGVKNLVGKVERAGESMTRKLSASWRGKWKGLGKKKNSMNVGGLYVVGRER